MPQLNNAQARIIDPVLTQVAQGFKQADFVGFDLFPRVQVAQRGGRITAFSKEDFMLYNTGRAPGQNTKRVQFGYAAGNYVLESHSLEGTVPIETLQEAAAVPSIDLAKKAIYNMQNVIATRLEKAQADVARTLGSYAGTNRITLSGTGQWSDFGAVSDPIAVVEAGKEAVRRKIGKRPNTAVMGAAVFASLRQHPKVIDRMKYTGRDVPTAEIMASLFGFDNILIGDAVWADDAGNFNDVWGKDMILAYNAVGTLADMGLPSYGYTYQLAGYPVVEEPYYERNPKTWMFPVTDEVAPVMAGPDAGYLIQNAVA
jgi:Phage major capsid protein E